MPDPGCHIHSCSLEDIESVAKGWDIYTLNHNTKSIVDDNPINGLPTWNIAVIVVVLTVVAGAVVTAVLLLKRRNKERKTESENMSSGNESGNVEEENTAAVSETQPTVPL